VAQARYGDSEIITNPSVFVLGAGASLPYGYPSGATLIGEMLGLQADVAEVLRELKYVESQWGAFQKALRRSAQSSIDAFLEARPDMRELGKLLIAAYIMRCESEDSLFPGHDDHWYPLLLNKLGNSFDELSFANISIITFNYDRSLEHFLFLAMRNRYDKSPKEVSDALSKLRIIHAYGHVGQLQWQSEDGRPYSPELSADTVKRAAEGIKIISEGRDDSPELADASELLRQSRRVFLVGMGYHEDNMRRIGFPLEHIGERHVVGSCFGLTIPESHYYRDRYRLTALGHDNAKCRQFLRCSDDFIRL
jgi:hypothetical protein